MKTFNRSGSTQLQPKTEHGQIRRGITESISDTEFAVATTNKVKMTEQLVTKYSTVKGVNFNWSKLSDREQAKVAIMCENTNKHMYSKYRLNETQISNVYGGLTPEKVNTVVRLGVVNSNLGNIFKEVDMTTTDDVFFIVRPVMDGATGGARDASARYNSTNAYFDALNNKPHYESTERYFGSEKLYAILSDTYILSDTPAPISALIPSIPVRRHSITLVVNGMYAGTDDGKGGLMSDLVTAGIVNYEDGTVTGLIMNDVAIKALPQFGLVNADTIEIGVEYNFNAELAGNFKMPQMKIDVKKGKFNARLEPMGWSFTDLARIQMESTGLADAKDLLTATAGEMLKMSRDYRGINLARRVALTNPKSYFEADITKVTADNEIANAQMLPAYIEMMGNAIFNDLKRGAITKIVAGANACTFMKLCKAQWVDDNSQAKVGVHLVGRLSGVEVYKCPSNIALIKDNEIMGIYKNEQNDGEQAIYFGTMYPMLDLGELKDPFGMKNYGAMGFVGDNVVVQPKFIRLMEIKGLYSHNTKL